MATKSAETVQSLRKENEALKAKVKQLEKQNRTSVSAKKRGFPFKSLGFILFAGVSGALLVCGQLFFWAGRTLTDTDRYTNTVAPLIAEPSIQEALAKKSTDALFARVNTEEVLTESLPPRISFLAPTLSAQIESATYQAALKITQDSRIKDLWVKANRAQHEALMNVIRNEASQDGVINLDEVYTGINDELRDSKLSFLADRNIPDRIGNIEVFSSERLGRVHWLVVNLPTLRMLSIVAFLASMLAAVWLAARRRRAVVSLMITYVILLFLTAISVRLLRANMLQNVKPEFQTAFTDAWRIIFSSLFFQLFATALLGTIVGLVAFLGGNSRPARSFKKSTTLLLEGKLQQALYKNSRPSWAVQLGKHTKAIYITLTVLTLVLVAMVPISSRTVLLGSIFLALTVATVRILGIRSKK